MKRALRFSFAIVTTALFGASSLPIPPANAQTIGSIYPGGCPVALAARR